MTEINCLNPPTNYDEEKKIQTVPSIQRNVKSISPSIIIADIPNDCSAKLIEDLLSKLISYFTLSILLIFLIQRK